VMAAAWVVPAATLAGAFFARRASTRRGAAAPSACTVPCPSWPTSPAPNVNKDVLSAAAAAAALEAAGESWAAAVRSTLRGAGCATGVAAAGGAVLGGLLVSERVAAGGPVRGTAFLLVITIPPPGTPPVGAATFAVSELAPTGLAGAAAGATVGGAAGAGALGPAAALGAFAAELAADDFAAAGAGAAAAAAAADTGTDTAGAALRCDPFSPSMTA
jgi:hypothetical protein